VRLDKYLKVSRIIKRRTVAKEVCDAGRISVNGRPAKAGTEVKPGDKLAIGFGSRRLEVEILAVPETVRAEAARDLYRVLADSAGSTTGDAVEID
jgi:ribosomal 50S subunit-recycling heat shock protein